MYYHYDIYHYQLLYPCHNGIGGLIGSYTRLTEQGHLSIFLQHAEDGLGEDKGALCASLYEADGATHRCRGEYCAVVEDSEVRVKRGE